jgi:hypothetical protein
VKIMKITAAQTRMLKALAETGDFYAGSGGGTSGTRRALIRLGLIAEITFCRRVEDEADPYANRYAGIVITREGARVAAAL